MTNNDPTASSSNQKHICHGEILHESFNHGTRTMRDEREGQRDFRYGKTIQFSLKVSETQSNYSWDPQFM